MARVRTRIGDGKATRLIAALLKTGVLSDGFLLPTDKGTRPRRSDLAAAGQHCPRGSGLFSRGNLLLLYSNLTSASGVPDAWVQPASCGFLHRGSGSYRGAVAAMVYYTAALRLDAVQFPVVPKEAEAVQVSSPGHISFPALTLRGLSKKVSFLGGWVSRNTVTLPRFFTCKPLHASLAVRALLIKISFASPQLHLPA